MSLASWSSTSPLAADLDLRLVRYFTVVAEHGHIGRAAAALHVAQPSLSRQIQRLEGRLGVRLFDRTAHGTPLSPAGRAFLPQALALLGSAQQAVATVNAATGPRTLTVGYVDDLVVTPAIRAVRERHPDARVVARHVAWRDSEVVLHGQVDALVARLPLVCPMNLLRTTTLYEEPRVLVLPRSHPLADRESVRLGDLSGNSFVDCAAPSTSWTAYWRLETEPNGTTAPVGDPVHSFEDKLETIAQGRAIAVSSAGDRRIMVRADLITVPIVDVDPCVVAVVTRRDDRDELTSAFVAEARRHLVWAADDSRT